jgi:hypothetical protein
MEVEQFAAKFMKLKQNIVELEAKEVESIKWESSLKGSCKACKILKLFSG